MNTPKLDRNQPEINEKPTFERVAHVTSDISQDFRPAEILGVPQAVKGFEKSDFFEVLSISQQMQELRSEMGINGISEK